MNQLRRNWCLYVGENEPDLLAVRAALPRNEFPVSWARSAAEALTHLENTRWDVLIIDYTLPDMHGFILLEKIRAGHPELPVLMLNGRADEVLAVSAKRKGASALLLKSDIGTSLKDAAERAVAERAEYYRQRSEPGPDREQQERVERINSILLETMSEGCLLVDGDGIVTFSNPSADRLMGVESTRLPGRPLRELFDAAAMQKLQPLFSRPGTAAGKTSAAFEAEVRGGRAAGRITVLVSARPVQQELGPHTTCLLMLADVSELIKTRSALRARLAEVERFQNFFMERERRIIELKQKLRDYERRLGIESPGLSDETRREIERRLGLDGQEPAR